ncbi:MAG: hypothetical protein H6668_19800 [Ardenticatenaceae bacterium]|nr:hypothetical protein [Ardenticatenaceae bacterium]
MSSNFWLLLIVVAIFIWGVVLLSRRPKFEPTCVKCESKNVVEVDRRTIATRTVEPAGGGTPGGGSVRLQIDSEVTLHCKACGHRFRRTITETH